MSNSWQWSLFWSFVAVFVLIVALLVREELRDRRGATRKPVVSVLGALAHFLLSPWRWLQGVVTARRTRTMFGMRSPGWRNFRVRG